MGPCQLSPDTAVRDVYKRQGGGVCLYRHSHVGDIAGAQVQFGDASGAFQYDWVIAGFQAVEGLDSLSEKCFLLVLYAEIVFGGHVADRFTVQYDLRTLVAVSYTHLDVYKRQEQERLKNEMTLTFNVYNTLAQKLEQDKLRVQEQTPVYTIIQPATVPLKAASPKKPLILIGFVFLAIFGGVGYLFIKDLFNPKEETEVLEVE